jgi:hypothetical protein
MGKVGLFGVCILAASFTGCGGKKGGGGAPAGGSETPEAVARALVASASGGEHGADGLFPPDDKLKAAATCTGGETLVDKLAKAKADVQRQLKKSHDMKFEFVSGEAGEIKTLAKGAVQDGCTVNEEVQAMHYKMKFKITAEGKTDDESEGIDLIKLGSGGWYLANM